MMGKLIAILFLILFEFSCSTPSPLDFLPEPPIEKAANYKEAFQSCQKYRIPQSDSHLPIEKINPWMHCFSDCFRIHPQALQQRDLVEFYRALTQYQTRLKKDDPAVSFNGKALEAAVDLILNNALRAQSLTASEIAQVQPVLPEYAFFLEQKAKTVESFHNLKAELASLREKRRSKQEKRELLKSTMANLGSLVDYYREASQSKDKKQLARIQARIKELQSEAKDLQKDLADSSAAAVKTQ